MDHDLVDTLGDRLKMMVNNKDAVLVSDNDDAELETVRKNLVVKRLGVEDRDKGMKAIHKVAGKMSGINQKSRIAFYYMVQKELK